MKVFRCKFLVVSVLIAGALTSCAGNKDYRQSPNEIASAVIYDVRWNQRDRRLSEKGRDWIYELDLTAVPPKCLRDDKPILSITFPKKLSKEVQEYAYYCRDEKIYWYRQVDFARHQSRFAGPFRLEIKKPREATDEDFEKAGEDEQQ